MLKPDRSACSGPVLEGIPRSGDGLRLTLAERLRNAHLELKRQARFRALDRMAIALYDAKTDILKTFIHSSGGEHPLEHYEARLSDSQELQEHFLSGEPRVVNDLSVYDRVPREHARKLREAGYRSSLTLPIYHRGQFFGFIFFNSRRTGFFTPSVTHHLMVHAELIALLLIFEFSAVETLQAAVETAREISAQRDNGTGRHLDRMSRFARLIATELSGVRGLSDEYVEYVFQFAPLHDIGKVAIPDSILLSSQRLVGEELEIMRSHVDKGVQIVEHMIRSFGLQSLHHTDILRNIVAAHHENWDGSGYPRGLAGEDIPLEARIVAVADVFDALTSRRSYKDAWSVEEALEFFGRGAGTQFDPDCVAALERRVETVREIRAQFREDPIG